MWIIPWNLNCIEIGESSGLKSGWWTFTNIVSTIMKIKITKKPWQKLNIFQYLLKCFRWVSLWNSPRHLKLFWPFTEERAYMSHNLLKAHRVETKATVAPVRQVASGNTPIAPKVISQHIRPNTLCLWSTRSWKLFKAAEGDLSEPRNIKKRAVFGLDLDVWIRLYLDCKFAI